MSSVRKSSSSASVHSREERHGHGHRSGESTSSHHPSQVIGSLEIETQEAYFLDHPFKHYQEKYQGQQESWQKENKYAPEPSHEDYLSDEQAKEMNIFFQGLEKSLDPEAYVCQSHFPDDLYLNEPS